MKITLTGLKSITTKLDALEDTIFSKTLMGDIGMFAMGRIKKRTIAGDDVYGIGFKPYNPLYAKERQKAGYSPSPVDLTRTGSMLSAMTYNESKRSVDIFYMNTTDTENTRNPAKAFWNNAEREFFALSNNDVEGITDIVNKYYRKLMRS